MKNILLVTLIPCLLLASIDSTVSSKQVKTVITDKKEKNYKAVLDLLQTMETKKEVSVDKKGSKTDKEAVITKYKAEKYMLPIPRKSITIGNKITVYADYKENIVENIEQTEEGSQVNMSIETKSIKLRLGDRFGDWKLVWIGENYIRYQNLKYPKRFIKKYY